ncbi:MAG: TraR/DksA C4-type zinc finger protein [Rhodobacteraceae bacterium]|nr:TraR/DksA C4-type zinc finger protein [Paracoccaceae bacterium]
MPPARLSRYRNDILARIDALAEADDQASSNRATVILDQQSVGRLSRMDALQQQAMANATYRRRQGERARLQAALARIDNGSFGDCMDCGEAIPDERLVFDPTVPRCLDCTRG